MHFVQSWEGPGLIIVYASSSALNALTQSVLIFSTISKPEFQRDELGKLHEGVH